MDRLLSSLDPMKSNDSEEEEDLDSNKDCTEQEDHMKPSERSAHTKKNHEAPPPI